MLALWRFRTAPPTPRAAEGAARPGWWQQKLVGETARALGMNRRAVACVFKHVGFELGALRTLSRLQLADLPEVSPEDAEKFFYLAQWEALQTHLELHGALPEEAELAPLLGALTPIFKRHFEGSDRLSVAFLVRYRALLNARQRACWWQRPCLELLPHLPASDFWGGVMRG